MSTPPDSGVATDLTPHSQNTDTTPAAPTGGEDTTSIQPPRVGRLGHVLGIGLAEASRHRLVQVGFSVVDDPGSAGNVDLVAVSTRLPRGRPFGLVADIRSATDRPIIGVVHPGGEAVAVELVRAGAEAVVAEGNEGALVRMLRDDIGDETLVEAFAGTLGHGLGGESLDTSRDPITSLPSASVFESRFDEIIQEGTIPRILLLQIANFGDVIRRTDPLAMNVLRRRLAHGLADTVRRFGGELFSMDDSSYAVIARWLDPDQISFLGSELSLIVSSYAPSGTPLTLAIGHAGPEVASDAGALRELTSRALHAALAREGGGMVNAEDLWLSLTSSTELEAALRIADHADRASGYMDPHAMKVADLAADIARRLGVEVSDVTRIRLAARLHDVGRTARPPIHRDDLSDDDENQAHPTDHSHVEWAARFARVSAGETVSHAIRHQLENWDGSGPPDGLERDAIPIGARIIAVADAFESWTSPPHRGEPLTTSEALRRLRDLAGSRFDPEVVEAVIAMME